MQQITDALWNGLALIVAAAITAATGYVITFIRSKIKNEKVRTILETVTNIVFSTVDAVSQTTVNTLKKAGKWDEAGKKLALEEAKTKIMESLNDASRKIISEVYNLPVEEWVTLMIESYIKNKE